MAAFFFAGGAFGRHESLDSAVIEGRRTRLSRLICPTRTNRCSVQGCRHNNNGGIAMKVGKWVAAVVGIVVAAAAGPVAAQKDRGLYIGGSIGAAQFDEVCDGLTVRCDDMDTGWRVFAGYQVNRYFALEGAYANMGKAQFEGTVPPFGAANRETEAYGFDAVAVLYFPVLDWMSLLAKAGAYRIRVASEVSAGGVTQEAGGKTSGGITWGVGAEFRVAGLGIRAEFQRYDNVGHPSVGEGDLLFYSAGVLWRF